MTCFAITYTSYSIESEKDFLDDSNLANAANLSPSLTFSVFASLEMIKGILLSLSTVLVQRCVNIGE